MKDQLLKLVLMFATLQKDLRDKANTMLSGLGEIEKVEASGAVISALRDLEWTKERIMAFAAEAGEQLKDAEELVEKLAAGLGEEAITAALEAKELMRKEDVEAAINSAKEGAKREAEAEFNAEREKAKVAKERRAEAEKEIGKIAAAALSDEQLAADDYEISVAAMKKRLAKLEEAGISAEKSEKAVASMLASPLTKEGEAEFQGRVESVIDLLGGATPQKGGKAAAPVSGSQPNSQGSGEDPEGDAKDDDQDDGKPVSWRDLRKSKAVVI